MAMATLVERNANEVMAVPNTGFLESALARVWSRAVGFVLFSYLVVSQRSILVLYFQSSFQS
jgi:hypothetical protein